MVLLAGLLIIAMTDSPDEVHGIPIPRAKPAAERTVAHQTVELPELKVIAKASFGFGDVNGCVIYKKFEG